MKINQACPLTLDFQRERLQCQRVERLIAGAIAGGRLSRQQEDAILIAITIEHPPTAELCSLFRQLQERVWQADLLLDFF